MLKQIEIEFSGEHLRDIGIQLATDNAESKSKDWKNITWELFKDFLKDQIEPFMMESFRSHLALIDGYEFPPSGRAYGWIALKAARVGLIKKIGHRNVLNARAHACFAALWVKI